MAQNRLNGQKVDEGEISVFKKKLKQTVRVDPFAIKELTSNHDHAGNKNVTNLHIWQWKTIVLHALHVHFSFFDILQKFSFFPRREMTCFAVQCADDVSIWWQMFNLHLFLFI